MFTKMTNNEQNFDPFDAGWQLLKNVLFLCRRQLIIFLHWGHGARAFPLKTNILTHLMIGLAATAWGSWWIGAYWSLYSLLSTIHLLYRLKLTEPELPHTHYDGEPWLLHNVIPYQEFPKSRYPVWFVEDSEILVKMVEPFLFVLMGYVIFDVGETKLGLYLMLVGLGSWGSVILARMEMMDNYYDQLDAENQSRYNKDLIEGRQPKHHKGFKAGLKSEPQAKDEKPKGLTESEIKARVEAIKAQAQAPPAKEDQAIGKDKTSPNASTPSPTPTVEAPAETQGNIIIFEEDESDEAASVTIPISNTTGTSSLNGNGTPKTATATIVKPVKFPKSKGYPKS